MTEFQINDYLIKINNNNHSINIKIIYNFKTYSVHINNYNNNNNNNVILTLKCDLYNFLINCFNQKKYYDYQIINNNIYIDIYFTFKYEMFDFNYMVILELD